MTITAAKARPIDHNTLKQAVAQAQGELGATVDQIITTYHQTANDDTSPYEIATTLGFLTKAGHLNRTKGPRGENLYLAAPQAEEDPVERLQREKLELQRALGTLTTGVTFATARLDQHQKRDDHWRELLQANDEAKQVLAATQEQA